MRIPFGHQRERTTCKTRNAAKRPKIDDGPFAVELRVEEYVGFFYLLQKNRAASTHPYNENPRLEEYLRTR